MKFLIIRKNSFSPLAALFLFCFYLRHFVLFTTLGH